MNLTTLLAALLSGALLALGAHAQDQKPAAEAKPAAESAEATKPAPGQEPDPKIIEGIMDCLAVGLTPDWQRTWIIATQISQESGAAKRQYVAEFFYATSEKDKNGRRMRTCGDESVLKNIAALNDYLPESQRRWTGAVFVFYRDGRYTANYDYTPVKPLPPEKPAARKKPAAKKQSESTAK